VPDPAPGAPGCDLRSAATLTLPDDVVGQFDVGLDLARRDELELIGTEGKVVVPDPWLCRPGASSCTAALRPSIWRLTQTARSGLARAKTTPTASSWTPPLERSQGAPRHASQASARYQVSYTHNMAGRGLHKEIRKAIAEAEQAGLRVVTFSGHTWGQVECPCGQHIKIYSTGRNPEFGAKLIHGFIRRHRDHRSTT
jgi:hypothetical protein